MEMINIRTGRIAWWKFVNDEGDTWDYDFDRCQWVMTEKDESALGELLCREGTPIRDPWAGCFVAQ